MIACRLQTTRATSVIPIGQLRISLGEYNLKGPEVPESKEERVVNAILHPDHKCGKYMDDIALLELARPIIWSDSVKPACYLWPQENQGIAPSTENSPRLLDGGGSAKTGPNINVQTYYKKWKYA
ncbi:uncharacterized protein LOC100871784 [Apis florea]|uniref:uncharacterized protein LOC100871784 n=1 Tax=Apis florea TaxID=7463 RepID=UPI0012FF5932|nr:uncharacterized protein LOC100871784 [Apis florea]